MTIVSFPLPGYKITTTTDFQDNFLKFLNTSNSITFVNTSSVEVEVSLDGMKVDGKIPPNSNIFTMLKINQIAFRSSTPATLYIFIG